jgi:hypothetical protein
LPVETIQSWNVIVVRLPGAAAAAVKTARA